MFEDGNSRGAVGYNFKRKSNKGNITWIASRTNQ